jgi:cytidyltransferase-like protein
MKYPVVCVAGTFDGLHKGHEKLLSAAFKNGERVLIGLTTDHFVSTYKTHISPIGPIRPIRPISSFVSRKTALESWLAVQGYSHYEIFPLEDPIGPAATAAIDALVITSQNGETAKRINVLRKQHGHKPVQFIEVSLVSAQDTKHISSTRIRNGEIDAAGRLVMPDNMRSELSVPLGKVLINKLDMKLSFKTYKDSRIISVGDQTTKTILDAGITPKLAIIDNKVNRQVYHDLDDWKKTVQPSIKIKSGPGYISQEALDCIPKLVQLAQCVLEVDGEEDLLVLPVIVHAPLGSIVYYGQPDVGIVEVIVTDALKQKANDFLQKFVIA